MPVFPPVGVKVLSIGELTRSIKGLLEEGYSSVWVEGEVSNLSKPSSGHQYMTLKDDEAPLAAMLYRGIALRLRFDLRDGMRVIARGRLTVYMPKGEYQFLIEEIQPKGIGPLELAFRQLKEKLSLKGFFDPKRKKPLPRIPRRIVLLTSPTGSAVRDMLQILSRRWPAAEVWVCPVRVQGEGAAQEIAAALGQLNRLHASRRAAIDVIVLGRGGGDLEELWAFNEECVAQALFASRIPVVTGIGHEDDLTIADLVADVRALTPSEAAERVVPNRTDVLGWLDGLQARFRDRLLRRLEVVRERLDLLAARPCFRRPLDRIREQERRLDEWTARLTRAAQQCMRQAGRRLETQAARLEAASPANAVREQERRLADWDERLRRAIQHRVQQARQQLEAQAARLEGLSPLNVLARGYSLTRREDDGAVLRQPGQVQPGERIVTLLQHGRVVSRVEENDECRMQNDE
jgi:exodeoxyribonuclease VII large subunit